jgi:hypothetical protein
MNYVEKEKHRQDQDGVMGAENSLRLKSSFLYSVNKISSAEAFNFSSEYWKCLPAE